VRRDQSSTRRQARRADGLPSARRRFGQNFLVDRGAIDRVADAIAALAGATVVEIGPGRGALTDALIARGLGVVAVEIDRDLASRLGERHPDPPLTVVRADILEVPFASLGRDLVVAGNLPYNISKPVAMKMVDEREPVRAAVLMFQREVAQRITAGPGGADYGPLSVLAGRCYRIERLFDLPPGAFRPRPEVTSTLTRWSPRTDDALPDTLVPALKSVLRAAFAHRRQTLEKNLRTGLAGNAPTAAAWLRAAGLPGAARAEAIPPEGFVALARVVAAATL
jgi:16S rRNA (adenine1518-N6/adenine1519-N6)-dimethyltransferase